MLPDAKGKKEAMRIAKEWLVQFNAEADLMPNAGKAKTVDEIYKEYLLHQRKGRSILTLLLSNYF